MSKKDLFPLLTENDIEVRVGQVSKNSNKQTLLLYKTARTDANILDKVVGIENWQCKYYELKGHIYCSVGVRLNNEWIWKDDCGSESNVEQEKGEASDSFKRACFRFGLGRELYTAPQIWVDKKDGFTSWVVSHIAYNEDREIIELEIKDNKNEVVYTLKNKSAKKVYPSAVKEQLNNTIASGSDLVEKITDEQKKVLYGYVGTLTEEGQAKWMSYIDRKFGVFKIDDLSNKDANTLILMIERRK